MKKYLLSILLLTALAVQGFANCGCNCCDCGLGCGPIDSFYLATKQHLVLHNKILFTDETGSAVNKYKPGIGASLIFGANVRCFAFEIEGVYRRSCLDSETFDGNLTAIRGWVEDTAVMANVLFRYPFASCFEVRLGGGIGVDFHRRQVTDVATPAIGAIITEKVIFRNSQTLFAWQLMGDVSYYVTRNVAFLAGYTFFTTEKLKASSGLKSSHRPYSHNIYIGALVKF